MDKKEKKRGTSYIEKPREIRVTEVKPIFEKLTEMKLNMTHEPVKKLYKQVNEFLNTGVTQQINIPFPEINRKIKGILSGNAKEQSWVKLEVIE